MCGPFYVWNKRATKQKKTHYNFNKVLTCLRPARVVDKFHETFFIWTQYLTGYTTKIFCFYCKYCVILFLVRQSEWRFFLIKSKHFSCNQIKSIRKNDTKNGVLLLDGEWLHGTKQIRKRHTDNKNDSIMIVCFTR